MAKGSFLVAKAAARILIEQGMGGDVIYISSKNSVFAGPNNIAYSATKADQAHQVRLLAVELGEHGVKVNGINPDGVVRGSGIFASGWGANRAATYGVEEDLGKFYAQRTILKREVLPENVANAVSVLTGPDLSHLVGLVGLRRRVRDVVGAREDRVLRGDVDDVAAHALLDEDGGGRLGDEERALGHDVVLEVPVRFRRLEEGLGEGDARVVHDDVEPAEPGDGPRHERLDLGVARDVRRDDEGARAGRLHPPAGLLEIGLRSRRHGDGRPRPAQGHRDRPAEAAARAGDHRHLAGEDPRPVAQR
jgi:hypothetical protein